MTPLPDTAATHATHATESRPSRVLVVLAAVWMILSLAIGGSVTAENRASAVADTISGVTAAQP